MASSLRFLPYLLPLLWGCSGFQAVERDARPKQDAGGEAAVSDGAGPDLRFDPQNCGRLERSCLGGACLEGVCQPMVLASSRSGPADVAVTGEEVFWVEQGSFGAGSRDGKLMRVPRGGCDTAGDCPEQLGRDYYSPGGVTVSGDYLYWVEFAMPEGEMFDTGSVLRMHRATKEIVSVAIEIDRPKRITSGEERLFWTSSDHKVYAAFLEGGTGPMAIADATSPVTLAVGYGQLFVLTFGENEFDGELLQLDITGKNPLTLAENQRHPVDLAVGSTYVWWVNAGNGTLMRVPRGGGSRETVRSALEEPRAVALDADWVYLATAGSSPHYEDGRIMARARSGDQEIILADDQRFPRALALDDDAVYWVNRGTPNTDHFDGSVMKVAKPQQ